MPAASSGRPTTAGSTATVDTVRATERGLERSNSTHQILALAADTARDSWSLAVYKTKVASRGDGGICGGGDGGCARSAKS